MTQQDQQKQAKKFREDWKDRGYEKGESQKFWLDLLCNVFGVTDFANFIEFEDQVHLDHTSFIDGYIPSSRVLIEQKSIDKSLTAPIRQSDGSLLNPFQQAKRYITELPVSKHPRWVITCNFQTFFIYDMEQPNGEPEQIQLKDFEKEYYRLSFLVDSENIHLKKELEVSKKAGDIIGEIYDLILAQYKDGNNPSPATLKSLNMLCVRLVFCLYAEDAGIFGHKSMFGDYINYYPASELRRALLELFKVLDQKPEERDPYLEDRLAAFPYVNGGLFTEEDTTIPPLTEKIKSLLVAKASDEFNWSEISPTIFGAIFESTLNPETRRAGGMHYTSIENIHKVIDPLFLDDLKEEFETIKTIKTEKIRNEKLIRFNEKLGSLKFLDPACGSGNFLTETYLSLRRLENQCIQLMLGGNEAQGVLFGYDFVKVHIQQFYGIEINDFACVVAKTALWIAECQMLQQTCTITDTPMNFLPLDNYSNIIEGDALQLDWNSIVSKEQLTYIMGNPPFIGARMMEQGSFQKKQIQDIFGSINDVQDLDYVTGWFKLASLYINDTDIECAFVATNSICQGSQVPILWNVLLNELDIKINFAYQTFKWESESNEKAAVHCVILGFSKKNRNIKLLYSSSGTKKIVKSISPYLFEGNNILISAMKTPLCNVPKMSFGNQPRDGGYFVISPDEKEQILKQEPHLEKYLKNYIGAEEFIKNKKRYCLWLKGISPTEIKKSKILYSKVQAVREFRLSSKAKTTNGYAKVPNEFAQITQPEGVDFLIIPRVSSERRRYVPMGFLKSSNISSDAVQIIPNANLFIFGVLTSNVHNAWMRIVCGRLEMRYRYSKEIVYNNFPWCSPTEEQKKKIEKTAQKILDARALYPDCSLADLYDETLMPPELRKAHQDNDKAVMNAYGFSLKMTESECVAELFKMYENLTKK